jgi:hypothetical protein
LQQIRDGRLAPGTLDATRDRRARPASRRSRQAPAQRRQASTSAPNDEKNRRSNRSGPSIVLDEISTTTRLKVHRSRRIPIAAHCRRATRRSPTETIRNSNRSSIAGERALQEHKKSRGNRDRNRCVVPGCSHGTYLDVHHVKPRAEGGDHDPDRLAVICGAHHRAVHEGRIVIEGLASERIEFFHADGTPYGGAVSTDVIELKTKAFQALRNLGFKESESRRALDAIEYAGTVTLEGILRQSLSILSSTH